jgi:hypothetical protein
MLHNFKNPPNFKPKKNKKIKIEMFIKNYKLGGKQTPIKLYKVGQRLSPPKKSILIDLEKYPYPKKIHKSNQKM